MRITSYGAQVRSAILPIALILLTPDSTCLRATQPETETGNRRGERGFVFLDGRYIAPPYVINLNGETLSINGHELREEDLDYSAYGINVAREPNPMPDERRCQPLRQRTEYTSLMGTYHQCLHAVHTGGVAVLFTNRQPMFLDETDEGQHLITTLTNPLTDRAGEYEIPESLEFETRRATWALLVSGFQSSPEFLARGTTHIGNLERVQRKNSDSSTHHIWKARIEYPLTAFAMVMVALAFGHLMSTKPYIAADAAFTTDSPSPQQTVFRSLLIVGMLSVVDLIWTVVASDSGSMRELNPFGSQLIDRPLRLIAFKSATTTLAIGLLYWLHRTPIAQAASWWSCLVLTLVTSRWLIFSSMFL